MNDETKEINLLNVLSLLVRHWKSIVIFALVIGLAAALFGGAVKLTAKPEDIRAKQKVEFAKMDREKLEDQQKTVEKSLLDQNASIVELQAATANLNQQLIELSSTLKQQEEYNAHSPKMAISADRVAHEEAYFAVALLDRPAEEDAQLAIDLANQIVGAYVDFLTSDDLVSQILAALPALSDPSYVRELLNVYQVNTGVIKAQVMAADADTAKQMADILVDYAESCKSDMDSSVAKHRFSLVKRSAFEGADRALAQSQEENLNLEANLQKQVASIEGQIAQQEAAIKISQNAASRDADTLSDIQDELAARDIAAENQAFALSELKDPIKYAVIGLVVGLFIAVCWYAVKYIILQNEVFADEVMDCCTAPYMGNLTLEQKHSGFERLLQKDTVDPMLAMPQEDRWKIVAENMQIAIRNLEPGKVVLTGTASRGSLEKICQYMTEQKTGFEFIPATLPSITPGSASLILDSKAVFYVVCPDKTSMSLMKDGLESLKNLDREPIGLLLV